MVSTQQTLVYAERIRLPNELGCICFVANVLLSFDSDVLVVWNSLPAELRLDMSLSVFRGNGRTHLS